MTTNNIALHTQHRVLTEEHEWDQAAHQLGAKSRVALSDCGNLSFELLR